MSARSSDPPRSTQGLVAEVCAVLGWSEEARLAYERARADWIRAGRPAMPLGARDYSTTYRAKRRKK